MHILRLIGGNGASKCCIVWIVQSKPSIYITTAVTLEINDDRRHIGPTFIRAIVSFQGALLSNQHPFTGI